MLSLVTDQFSLIASLYGDSGWLNDIRINKVARRLARLVNKMGDRLSRLGPYIVLVCNQPLRPTQPHSTLSMMGNEYQPMCGEAVGLGSKGWYDSFQLWINVCI